MAQFFPIMSNNIIQIMENFMSVVYWNDNFDFVDFYILAAGIHDETARRKKRLIANCEADINKKMSALK